MKTNKVKIILRLLAASLLLTGCFSVDGYFKKMRNTVLNGIDGDYKREIEFGIGAAGLALSSYAVSFSDANDYADDMIRKIDRVQVGIYKTRDYEKPKFSTLKAVTSDLKDEGYEFIVRSVDHDEMTAVMVKNEHDNRLKEMFIVTLNDEELVLVQVFGDLDKLIEIALRENGLNVEVSKN